MKPGSSTPQENIVIRQFKKEDFQQTIKIHMDLFGSQSGLRFLEKAYYPTFLHPQSTGFCLVAVSKEQIAAFCSGALDASIFHRTLIRSHPWECFTAASRMVFLGREIWSQMLYSFRNLYTNPVNTSGGRIFFIATHKDFLQRGIASRLISKAFDHCRSHGLKQCWSRTLKSNTASYQLHTRLGFRLQPEMSKQDKNRFIFYCQLNSSQNP
jgi:ribosomal protein S18 acetylase RimI-like enzyme